MAGGQGLGQGAQRGRRLAARRGSSTLGVPPRMIVMSSWAESTSNRRRGRSGEVREREGSFRHSPIEPPLRRARLGRAPVALDARRAGGEHDRDPRLAAGRALLLRNRTFRRHVFRLHTLPVGRSRARLRDRPIHGPPPVESALPSNPRGRVLRKKAPKEQPPRNLSGSRTARARQLWKAGHLAGGVSSPKGKAGPPANLSGPATEGEGHPDTSATRARHRCQSRRRQS